MTNEERMIAYLVQNDQRLQELEDQISGTPGSHKQPEPDEKETEIDEFINQMKALNTTSESEPDEGGDDEDDFIKLMRNINK